MQHFLVVLLIKLVVEMGLKATNFEINILNINNYIKASQRKENDDRIVVIT